MRRVLLFLALLPFEPMTARANDGSLDLYLTDTLRGGGWTATSSGMSGRDGVPDAEVTLSPDSLAGGAIVKYAFLYWAVTSGTDATATVNGVPVTGEVVGTSVGCGPHVPTAYRADVTDLVTTGAGTYVIAGLPSSAGTTTPDTNGVTLLIIWENPAAADETTFVLWDGSITRTSEEIETLFDDFVVPPNLTKAHVMTLTDNRPTLVSFNGSEETATRSNELSSPSSSRWQTNVYGVNRALDPGETTLRVQSSSGSSCFVQTAAMLAMTTPVCSQSTVPPGVSPFNPTANESMQGFLTETLRGGGVVSVGAGFAGRGPSGPDVPVTQRTLAVAGIPAGASVRYAYLYWDTYGAADDAVTLDGVPVQGTAIGTSGGTCWDSMPDGSLNHGFRADVTALVPGNGSYVLANLLSAAGPGSGVDMPDGQGASLVVIYADPTADFDTTVVIYDGNRTKVGGTLTTVMRIPTLPMAPVAASLHLLVGDGQAALSDGTLRINGTLVPPAPGGTFSGSDGDFWDTRVVDVTALMDAGESELIWVSNGGADCLVFVSSVVTYTTPVESGAGPECGAASTTTTVTTTTTTTTIGTSTSTTSTVVTTSTSSSTATSSTTTSVPSTSTTTLPADAEQCANCQDDDGDGLTDLEDPDCCVGESLTLLRARLKPSKKQPGTTTTRLKLTLRDPGATVLDPSRQDTILQLHRRGGGFDFCARIPATAVVGRKGKSYRFRDRTGGVGSAAGIDGLVVRRKKNGTLLAAVKAKAAKFATPSAGPVALTLGFTDPDGTSRCAAVQPQLAPQGKKGALRAP